MHLLVSCQQDQITPEPHPLFSMDNLVAWCIIPYDNQNRSPQERAVMLNELGFSKMAYDWRTEHLPGFSEEIQILQEHGIELTAVWLWIDARAADGFLPEHDLIFDTLVDEGVSTRIWVGMHQNVYEGLDDDEKVNHVSGIIHRIHERAQNSGSQVSLYTHQGWLGIPENQVRVIKATGLDDLGIAFNFHHSHNQIHRFAEALEIMMPWLETVNLNGMEINGDQILDIGKGDYEKEMIETLIRSGYSGHIGIIGHTYDEDVHEVLERNLSGLNKILAEI
ncbi:MAG: AP endonuclease [Balneolaceae bacterium]|nr:MAG: AP endonuclease [Balneolaceae bacterium]